MQIPQRSFLPGPKQRRTDGGLSLFSATKLSTLFPRKPIFTSVLTELQHNSDVKLKLISGKSVYLSEHFPQYFKVRKIKMQQKVNGDFFGQKISDFGDF